jgi:hypothetical protein
MMIDFAFATFSVNVLTVAWFFVFGVTIHPLPNVMHLPHDALPVCFFKDEWRRVAMAPERFTCKTSKLENISPRRVF